MAKKCSNQPISSFMKNVYDVLSLKWKNDVPETTLNKTGTVSKVSAVSKSVPVKALLSPSGNPVDNAASNNINSHLLQLPDDILLEITKNLNGNDQAILTTTCKEIEKADIIVSENIVKAFITFLDEQRELKHKMVAHFNIGRTSHVFTLFHRQYGGMPDLFERLRIKYTTDNYDPLLEFTMRSTIDSKETAYYRYDALMLAFGANKVLSKFIQKTKGGEYKEPEIHPFTKIELAQMFLYLINTHGATVDIIPNFIRGGQESHNLIEQAKQTKRLKAFVTVSGMNKYKDMIPDNVDLGIIDIFKFIEKPRLFIKGGRSQEKSPKKTNETITFNGKTRVVHVDGSKKLVKMNSKWMTIAEFKNKV